MIGVNSDEDRLHDESCSLKTLYLNVGYFVSPLHTGASWVHFGSA